MPVARYVSTKNTIWTAPSASVRGPARRMTSRTPACDRSSENEERGRGGTGRANDIANAGMRQVQRERVGGGREGELGKRDEPHHKSADDDADRDRVDTEEGVPELGEQDDHEVVDKRRCRAREEL